MANMVIQKSASLNGRVYSRSVTVTDDGIEQVDPTVAASLAATLTTRYDVDTGMITLATGHGILAAGPVHMYWVDVVDLETVRCHRAIADVVTATTVTFGYVPGTGSDATGHGDGLPPAGTAMMAMVPDIETFILTGTNVSGLAATMPKPGFVVLCSAGYVEQLAIDLRVYDSYIWSSDDGTTNPILGDTITQVLFSHNYTAGTVRSYAVALRS